MKLNEVDRTLNEGILDSAWAGAKAIGASAVGATDTAHSILAKNQFVNTFVRKMSTALATQWPAIQRAQQEELANKQKAQQAQQEKDRAMTTKTVPAPAQPSTIIDPNTGKPYVSTSESYNLFRRKFDKILKEATVEEENPEYGMDQFVMNVLKAYMKPIELTPYANELQGFAGKIAGTYQSNHAIPTLKDLGAFLFDVMEQYKQSQGMTPEQKPKTDQKVDNVLKTIQTMSDKEKQELMAALQPQPKS
ncbi:MAG: hypothetical protein ACOVLB_04370 [Candidatus Nanopelagicus sp.]